MENTWLDMSANTITRRWAQHSKALIVLVSYRDNKPWTREYDMNDDKGYRIDQAIVTFQDCALAMETLSGEGTLELN